MKSALKTNKVMDYWNKCFTNEMFHNKPRNIYVNFQELTTVLPTVSSGVDNLYAGHVFVTKQISRSQIKYNKGPGLQKHNSELKPRQFSIIIVLRPIKTYHRRSLGGKSWPKFTWRENYVKAF